MDFELNLSQGAEQHLDEILQCLKELNPELEPTSRDLAIASAVISIGASLVVISSEIIKLVVKLRQKHPKGVIVLKSEDDRVIELLTASDDELREFFKLMNE